MSDLNSSSDRIGYSKKVDDPAFAKYLKNSNRWSGIFSSGLALVAIIGFFVYGETSSEMDNPQALLIGLGIGGMFISIAVFQIISRGRNKTWDGTVAYKLIKKKQRKRDAGNNDLYYEKYLEYSVSIKSDDGKIVELTAEDDDTVYNYYQESDRVRHHGGLNSFEKYDKSQDDIIFCNACASLNDINDDYCFRCHCPLLR